MDDAVPGRTGRDLESVENRHAGGDQRAQRACEARHRRLAEQVAQHRRPEQSPIEHQFSAVRGIVPTDSDRDRHHGDDHRPPVILEEVAHPDHNASRQRQLHLDRREHGLERRDDEHQQNDDRDDGHGEDDRGIDHRALHLPDDRVVLLQEHREPQENGVENTAGFAGCDHVHIEVGESVFVLAQRISQGVATLDIVHHLLGDFGERLVLRLLGENVEGLHERQPGVDHRGELPREDHDVPRGDPSALPFSLRLTYPNHPHSLLAEVLDDVLSRREIDRRRLLFSGGGRGRVLKQGHEMCLRLLAPTANYRERESASLSGLTHHPQEFVLVLCHPQALLEGHFPLHVQRVQGVRQRLHPVFLAGLHRAENLMDLVVPDERPDGRRGDHDLAGHDPPLSGRSLQERLRDDALEHERQLCPDLRLLDGRERRR